MAASELMFGMSGLDTGMRTSTRFFHRTLPGKFMCDQYVPSHMTKSGWQDSADCIGHWTLPENDSTWQLGLQKTIRDSHAAVSMMLQSYSPPLCISQVEGGCSTQCIGIFRSKIGQHMDVLAFRGVDWQGSAAQFATSGSDLRHPGGTAHM